MQLQSDPIIARASATGRAGVCVIRLSGREEQINTIQSRLFGLKPIKSRYAHLLSVTDSSGELIDTVIVLRFVSPNSFTGEAVLELQSHGGQVIPQMLIERCLELGNDVGLRLAQPGEFSLRAFLNGRIDLTQAEAIADMIDANTEACARAAVRSMRGDFSKEIYAISDRLIELRTYVEATIDFPDEEIDFIENGRINAQVTEIRGEVERLETAAMRGKVLRDGLCVVLVGAPNVGKSSLMNALAGKDVAIVTDIAGTTRDRIEQTIQLDGVELNLIDTAGVRETSDKIEAIGVERTLEAIESADVVLMLSAVNQTQEDQQSTQSAVNIITPRLRDGVNFIHVINKVDLRSEEVSNESSSAVSISAKNGTGLDTLRDCLKRAAGVLDNAQGEFTVRTRHLNCLARGLKHLCIIEGKIGTEIGLDIAAEELRLAAQELGEIVGQMHSDDLLGRIFSQFCIGK